MLRRIIQSLIKACKPGPAWYNDAADASFIASGMLVPKNAGLMQVVVAKNKKKFKCCEQCPGDDTCENALICVCGDPVDHSAFGAGHSPVSAHDYYAKETDAD